MSDNINTVAHRWLKEQINPNWIAMDGTAGNGNDTLFLLQHCKKVYAFDIQTQAMENTLKRCAGYNGLSFFLMGHEHCKEVIKEPIDCAVFNFGYLPHADPTCITLPETSVQAIQSAYELLNPNGILMLACYIGHPGGKEEHGAIVRWIQNLTEIELRTYQQRENAPILYEIKKGYNSSL